MSLQVFLYVLGAILLALAALGVNLPRVSLGWLGLAVVVFAFGVLPAIH
jgi:hypothetical protein